MGGKRKRDANGKIMHTANSLKPRPEKDQNRPGRRNGSENAKTEQKRADDTLHWLWKWRQNCNWDSENATTVTSQSLPIHSQCPCQLQAFKRSSVAEPIWTRSRHGVLQSAMPNSLSCLCLCLCLKVNRPVPRAGLPACLLA